MRPRAGRVARALQGRASRTAARRSGRTGRCGRRPRPGAVPSSPAVAGTDRFYLVLMRAANALRRASDARALASAGVTTAQAGALYVISQSEGPSQRDLGRELGLGEAAVAGLVGRLERMGLVARTPDPRDRRTWRLSLTDEGRAAIDGVEPSRVAVNEEIADLLGDDVEVVTAALERLERIDRPGA